MRIFAFFKVIKLALLDGLAYRSETYMQVLAWFINFLIQFYLWSAIYETKSEIVGYTLTSMISYFFIVQMIRTLTFSHFGFLANESIKDGDLVNLLTKPVSVLPFWFAIEIGQNLIRFIFALIGNFIIVLFFYKYLDFSHINLLMFSLGIFSLIPAFIISFCFTVMIGALAFWIQDANRLIFFYFAIISLASGWMIPLDLMPEKYYDILMLTPFPYTFFTTIKLIQGTLPRNEIAFVMLMQSMYAITMIYLLHLQLKFGIKHFEGTGR